MQLAHQFEGQMVIGQRSRLQMGGAYHVIQTRHPYCLLVLLILSSVYAGRGEIIIILLSVAAKSGTLRNDDVHCLFVCLLPATKAVIDVFIFSPMKSFVSIKFMLLGGGLLMAPISVPHLLSSQELNNADIFQKWQIKSNILLLEIAAEGRECVSGLCICRRAPLVVQCLCHLRLL